MTHRLEIELTSNRDDGTWTWRAAGARQPKGVLNAGLIVGLNDDAPIGLVPDDFAPARWLGLLGFIGAIVWLYGWMLRRSAAMRR